MLFVNKVTSLGRDLHLYKPSLLIKPFLY